MRAKSCAPLANAAVYAWHCDRDGNYSMYSQGVTNENYLRGVQAAGADGIVTFTSIFPACYQGRWPHVHFEIYPSLDRATDPANRIATSQIALPSDICKQVYATDGYASSQTTFPQVSLASDMVFGNDQGIHQIGAMSGTIDFGPHRGAAGPRPDRLTAALGHADAPALGRAPARVVRGSGGEELGEHRSDHGRVHVVALAVQVPVLRARDRRGQRLCRLGHEREVRAAGEDQSVGDTIRPTRSVGIR